MIVVNFFGGPGSGKSTTAAQLFAHLKLSQLNCELVTEFAKDLTWDGATNPLAYQPLVFGQQTWRLERLRGKVDVVVTDSPLLLSLIYCHDTTPQPFHDYVKWEFDRDNNINFLLLRHKPYSPVGRNQTEEQAVTVDYTIVSLLKRLGIPNTELTGDGSAPIKAFGIVMQRLAVA
jgi:nicotinamide riboside kinase